MEVFRIYILLAVFLINIFGPIPVRADDFLLPKPGTMIQLSPAFEPAIFKGIKVHPDNPFKFEFVLDKGDGHSDQEQLKKEATKLIKYFLASLTIPEKDLWVNLSPYEKDRIVPDAFGKTEMGRDLLAQDYMLKQITASLIYPEDEIGRKFWQRIYTEAGRRFGTTNIPVNTFNKVWIMPEKAVVYENAETGTAYISKSRLKVMLEEDYLALSQNAKKDSHASDASKLGSSIVREIVIPELTNEINEGRNFAKLRQVYQSLILAAWYKRRIKDSILGQVYMNKNKVNGVAIDDPLEKQKIYERYLQAFKKGVYNYIKDESDPVTREVIPRKYFSGGFSAEALFGVGIDSAMRIEPADTMGFVSGNNEVVVQSEVIATPPVRAEADAAMSAETGEKLKWDTEEEGINNVSQAIQIHRPDIIGRYKRLNSLSPVEVKRLRADIYRISSGYFKIWKLASATQRQLAPYFYGSHIIALQKVFPDLNLNPLGFRLDWSSEENAIASVRYVLSKEMPDIVRRYENINSLNVFEVSELREDIYRITKAHFAVWGIVLEPTYFDGSYIVALQNAFPRLDLNSLGFRLDWSNEERGIASVRYVINRERPDIIKRYDSLDSLSPLEINKLLEDIYKFNYGYFRFWGLNRAGHQQSTPYFHGSYITALQKVFARLGLDPLGFGLDWSTEERGIASVRYVISRERPDIARRYSQINSLAEPEKERLRDDIYRISAGHLKLWGASGAGNRQAAPYFKGSFILALEKVFANPSWDFSEAGMRSFIQRNKERRYQWRSAEESIDNVIDAIRINEPDLFERYERFDSLTPIEREQLSKDVYAITDAHFRIWGLSAAMGEKVPYFNGTFISALQQVFPRLNLDPLEFKLDWSTEERSIASMRYALKKERPDIISRYDSLNRLSFTEKEKLRNDIYKITRGQLDLWGLGSVANSPNFASSHIVALQKVFARLALDPLGFQLDWSTEERGIASIRYILKKERPDIMRQYDDFEALNSVEKSELREAIYRITKGHLETWGLASVGIKATTPYFYGSHFMALEKVFAKLELDPLGFQLDWFNEERGIASVRYVLAQEIPDIVQRYNKLDLLDSAERQKLKEDIREIRVAHLLVWGLGAALNERSDAYFHQSYTVVLQKVFSNLNLDSAQMADRAQTNTGGIDLTSDKVLSVQNNGQEIKFHIDPAMLQRLQNAPGFTPVIINIQPMVNVRTWLGINNLKSANKIASI